MESLRPDVRKTGHVVRAGRVAVAVLLCSGLLIAGDAREDLAVARRSLQTGRYDEAIDAYRKLLTGDDLPAEIDSAATIGLSEALEARGLADLAMRVVNEGRARQSGSAALLARQAQLQFQRGSFAEAGHTADAALKIDSEQLLARLIRAHVFTETGRLDEALDEYLWFVRYYNRTQPTDAESLLLVAEGSLQYARWKSASDIFSFVINTLCPDALADDPECWQAAHLSGRVLLEKYNRPQAADEFEAALKINPRAAEVLVSLGEASLQEAELEQAIDFAQQALTINPRLPSGLRLAGDVSLVSGDMAAAQNFADAALAINPHDQQTLALQAAVFLLEDGIPDTETLRNILGGGEEQTPPQNGEPRKDESHEDEPQEGESRFLSLWTDLITRNPKPGVFLTQVGDALDGRRKYAAAEVCYRRAIEVMPQLAAPRTNLGMLLMRTGKLDDAAQILDDAFKADPYHVRVSNMRKVIRQLNDYATISSDHFVIRVPKNERVLGEEMSRYLEQTYEELTATYGFEPETRTQFEVFGAASGQSAHQWFSARMVGLPWVQTIGASTGMIVALASPHDQPKPFNWARVIRHEFVHILTLQQTDFNIPHWYTEALAVRTEGAIPESWDTLLLQRVSAGKVFSLNDINRGFTRPEDPTDWNMAYCQSWLYAQYIEEHFGEPALFRLLDAYRQNRSTPDAIREVCQVEIDEFENGYTDFLNAYVDEIRRTRVSPPPTVETAMEQWQQRPDDLDAQANVAWSLWHQGERRRARDMAAEIHNADPAQPLAVAILAEFALHDGDIAKADELLETVFDSDDPHPAILERMALVQTKREDWSAAGQLWEEGVRRWPREPRFLRGLAATLLRQDDTPRLRDVLIKIAERDADDALVRKKLAHIAADAHDWTAAIRWAEDALHCDVRDASMHRLLADAYEQMGDSISAARHTDLARRLKDSNTSQ